MRGHCLLPEERGAHHVQAARLRRTGPGHGWANLKLATADILEQVRGKATLQSKTFSPSDIKAIGISYQMHGLVCVDKDLNPLRPAIIWCDSRAVPYGNRAFEQLGAEWCLEHLLNSPGNFTAAKLAWVKENEPEVFGKIDRILLPGDWMAAKMTGEACTTVSGLSEGIFWDFRRTTVVGPTAGRLWLFAVLPPGNRPHLCRARPPEKRYRGRTGPAAGDAGNVPGRRPAQ